MIDDKAFSRLKIPVHKEKAIIAKHKIILDRIYGDEFKKIKASRRKDLENLIKYVVYMYDIMSPLRHHYSDVGHRKLEAAVLAGYDPDREEKLLEGIFNFSDDVAKFLVSEFLKYLNNKTWAILQSNEEVLWQYNEELLQSITDFKTDKEKLQALDMKTKLMRECDEIVGRIEGYEQKIFGEDKSLLAMVRDTPTSPEDFAYVQEGRED